MRPVGTIIALATLLFAIPALAQSIWKWRDADGVVHYSDQPSPGAERIPLRAQGSASSTTDPVSSGRQESANAAPAAYTNLEIWKPADAQSFTEGALVSVGVRVEPMLASGHSLWLYLDGRRVDSPTADRTEYDLSKLARGDHTLTALIADGKGQRVLASKQVRFSIQ